MNERDRDSDEEAYGHLLAGAFPRVRDCDPKAYYRARLSALIRARGSILSDDEYEAERKELIDSLILGPRYPSGTPTVLFVCITGGLVWLVFAFIRQELAHFVGGGTLAAAGLWMLQGYRTHFAWLRSFSRAQRIDIVEYLRNANLMEDDEANVVIHALELRPEAK